MEDKVKNFFTSQEKKITGDNQEMFEMNWKNVARMVCVLLLLLASVWPFIFTGNEVMVVITLIIFIIFSFSYYYTRERLFPMSNRGQLLIFANTLQRQAGNYFRAKETLIYNGLLILILIAAAILRFANYTVLDPYTDEYFHLVAAKEYINEGTFSYSRAKLVTYLVAFFCDIGDASNLSEYVYWGRIPGIIFGSLTLLPLYYLTQIISKPVALVSALLWATSPWAIGVARTIREYAFYPFIVLLITLLFFKLIEMISNYKSEHLPKLIVYSVVIATILIYALYFDTASTLKVCIVPLFGVIFYYLILNISKAKELYIKNKTVVSSMMVLFIIIAICVILYGHYNVHVSFIDLNINGFWSVYYFVPNSLGSPTHWWGYNSFPFIAVFIFISGLVYALYRKQYNYLLFFIVFFLFLIFFIYFFDRYSRPRYIIYALPFFVTLISTGVYAFVEYMKQMSKPNLFKFLCSIAIVLFILQGFVFQNPMHSIAYDELGYVKATNEFHDSLDSTKKALKDELKEEYFYIATLPAWGLLILEFNIDQESIYLYTMGEHEHFNIVESIIGKKASGLIILDSRRNDILIKGFSEQKLFYIGDTVVKLLQNEDEMQIYRW